MASSRADGVFEVAGFVPVEGVPAEPIVTAMAAGVATLQKTYTGAVAGRSVTIFVGAQDAAGQAGTYVALEAFEGSLDERSGAFNFVHAASTHGQDRFNETFFIVESSGTGDLAGITGGGGLAIDADGTHRVYFDYDLD